MRPLRVLTFVAVLAAAVTVALSLPARRVELAVTSAIPLPPRGVLHVHTRLSDGTGTTEEVARAAADAGLQFVVTTDHGDATREPAPPAYVHGVLMIDAVEISTDGGHVVALGLGRSPYPLGGEPRDAIEDIARAGGFSIAAHPESPRSDLRWTDWTTPIDGLEWLNGDSEWRDETRLSLLRSLLTYPFRAPETLVRMIDRPQSVLSRWDRLTEQRRVIGVAGSDAHARIALRDVGDPYDSAMTLRMPGYEPVFRTTSVSLPQLRLTREAAADARAVITEIRAGHLYSSLDALASPAAFAFTGTSGANRAVAGDFLPLAGPVVLHVSSNVHGAARVNLLEGGERVATSMTGTLEYTAPDRPGVYRAEVLLDGVGTAPDVPWIVSNPIYVGRSSSTPVVPQVPMATQAMPQYTDGPATGWTVEHDPQSMGAMDVVRALEGTQISWRYALGGTRDAHPSSALVMPAGAALATADRLMFTVRADRPMRISVQLRAPSGAEGERWHRSIFVDETPRVATVMFDDMRPRGFTRTPHPDLAAVTSVLFVTDPVNTALGAGGQVWIDDVKYGR